MNRFHPLKNQKSKTKILQAISYKMVGLQACCSAVMHFPKEQYQHTCSSRMKCYYARINMKNVIMFCWGGLFMKLKWFPVSKLHLEISVRLSWMNENCFTIETHNSVMKSIFIKNLRICSSKSPFYVKNKAEHKRSVRMLKQKSRNWQIRNDQDFCAELISHQTDPLSLMSSCE